MKKQSVFFESIKIDLQTSEGTFPYFENGVFLEVDPVEAFGLEEFFWGSQLEGLEGPWVAFNTCNWGAPIVICGVYNEDWEGVVNIHKGGDVRGNYSGPYFTEKADDILDQRLWATIRLSNGRVFFAESPEFRNSELYFDTFDIYMNSADLEELPVLPEMIEEMENRCEEFKAEVKI